MRARPRILSILSSPPQLLFSHYRPLWFALSPLVFFGLARSVLAWCDVLGKPLSFSIYSSLGIAVPCELFCLAYSLRFALSPLAVRAFGLRDFGYSDHRPSHERPFCVIVFLRALFALFFACSRVVLGSMGMLTPRSKLR